MNIAKSDIFSAKLGQIKRFIKFATNDLNVDFALFTSSNLLNNYVNLKKQNYDSIWVRGSTKFGITVACGLKFHWYLRTLNLKFKKATI